MDGTTSSPVTHNVYTTGSGDGAAGGSSALHALIPAMMAMGQNSGMQHLPALAAAGLAGAGGIGRGAHAGLGAAAGGAIGFVLGALLNGGTGGLFGGNRTVTNDLVTTTHLQAALNQQTQSTNTNAILQQLATIQQLIPENEGKVQLAIAQSQIAQSNIANQNAIMTAQGISGVNLGIAASTAATNQIVREAKDVSESGFAAGQLALANVHSNTLQGLGQLGLQAANNLAAIAAAIRDDGDKTRALVTSFNDATLNRIITTQANEIIELKGDRNLDRRTRETEVNVSQVVNQSQAQAQAQQQQQQQFLVLSNIASSLAGLTQLAHATNQNVIAGNTGAVTTGAQSANPVNVA